jgi:hypothetical protein
MTNDRKKPESDDKTGVATTTSPDTKDTVETGKIIYFQMLT